MNQAFDWFSYWMRHIVSDCNFAVTVKGFTFGIFDIIVATFLLGLVVRNFVHIAR